MALILPLCNTEAMNLHLAEIATKVATGAHAALIFDQAGWHMTKKLVVPPNITLLPRRPNARNLIRSTISGSSCANRTEECRLPPFLSDCNQTATTDSNCLLLYYIIDKLYYSFRMHCCGEAGTRRCLGKSCPSIACQSACVFINQINVEGNR